MGRGKIEIKKIENTTNRGVTFSKRKNGLFKKAYELSLLCDANVFIIVCSSSGKVVDYCSSNTQQPQLLEEYQKKSRKILWDAEHENLRIEIDKIKQENDAMEIQLRHLNGLDISSLHFTELMNMESILSEGNNAVQMEIKRKTEGKIQNSEEFHSRRFHCDAQEREMAENKVEEMENLYEEYQVKEPFAFRILHPDLHYPPNL